MLTLSRDPNEAERQMQAIIFFLTTFGYIDGEFEPTEQEYVRTRIASLVASHVSATAAGDPQRGELTEKFTRHFHEVFQAIDLRIQELLTESVMSGETPIAFVEAKLKEHCLTLLQSFDRLAQQRLLAFIDELMLADGEIHPAEAKFRAEISSLLEESVQISPSLLEETPPPPIRVRQTTPGEAGESHPFLTPFEEHYLRSKKQLAEQISADRALIDRALAQLTEERARGEGRLAGHQRMSEFAGTEPFLDQYTYVIPPQPGRVYDMLVLGDLHGCYSVLKAALMQSRFLDKVEAFRRDPEHHPIPKLILLGDYIDRGLFSLNGVLRTALNLLVAAPGHVHLLRGNHEYYLERKGQVMGGVMPADTIESLRPHFPADALRHYMRLFEALPSTLFFGPIMFVHGGLPRDRTLKRVWQDLSSLNHAEVRFQMMWSDPSQADVVPAALQERIARFAFGRLQFRAFMNKIGCHAMVRGHEKLRSGFARTYDGDEGTLITLFSAGGIDNADLPLASGYREVTPMALTILHDDSGTTMLPWKPDYHAYNDPERNAFYRPPLDRLIT